MDSTKTPHGRIDALYEDLGARRAHLDDLRDAAIFAAAAYDEMLAAIPRQSHYKRHWLDEDGKRVLVDDVPAYNSAISAFRAEHAHTIDHARARWRTLEDACRDHEQKIESLVGEIRQLEAGPATALQRFQRGQLEQSKPRGSLLPVTSGN